MIPWGSLLKIEREQGTVTLDAAIELLDSELQATVLLCRNGAAEEHFIGVDLRRGLLDVGHSSLDELGPARAAVSFPTAELGLETTRFGKFQKSA